MNINNQAQFAKDAYQVPVQSSQEVYSDTLQDNDPAEGQDFAEIARRYVDDQFEEIARAEENREFDAVTGGIEFEPTPAIEKLLRTGRLMQELRREHPSIKSPVDLESKSEKCIFPNDPQVIQRQFFYFPVDGRDEWFLRQSSTARAKSFTLSYDVTPQGVQKSATYYDAIDGREKNVIVAASDKEIHDLSVAATRYEEYARQFVYSETWPLLSRFVRKFKLGHTA